MTEHILIVGGGILGASVAYALSQKNVQVTLLEQHEVAAGATSKSFGWINANFSETKDYFALRMAAIAAYRELPEEVSRTADLQWGGSIWWEDEGAELQSHFAYLQSLGYPSKVIDRTEISALETHLASPPDRAIHGLEEASVDTSALTTALLRKAAQNGVRVLLGASVSEILFQNGVANGLRTSVGDQMADRIVLTAGAGCNRFLESLGQPSWVEEKQGLVVKTSPTNRLIQHLILSPDVHFRQGADGRFLVGEIFSGDGANAGRMKIDPVGLAEEVLARFKVRLPAAEAVDIDALLLGKRPVPKDGLPVVGTLEQAPNVYLAATHSGITLGPFLGQLIADELTGNGASPFLAPFRPREF